MKLRGLIKRYDSEFDLELNHDECIDELVKSGVEDLSTKAGTFESLCLLVALSWCRIIKADVGNNLRESAIRRDECVVPAKLLAKWTKERIQNGDVTDKDTEFACNVLARWFDGAGKAHYRHKEYTEARQLFEQATIWVDQSDLWFLKLDLNSNFRRAEYEVDNTGFGVEDPDASEEERKRFSDEIKEKRLARNKDLIAEYEKLLAWGNKKAAKKQLELTKAQVASNDLSRLPRKAKEFLRGYCSVLHNLSISYRLTGDTSKSLDLSLVSSCIAENLCDEYRLAQARLHQATIYEMRAGNSKEYPDAKSRALELFSGMSRMAWRRGSLIGQQGEYRVLGLFAQDKDELHGAINGLRSLLARIRAGSNFVRGEQSADLEVYFFTVDSLNKLCSLASENHGFDDVYVSELREFLADEQLAVLRSIRRVNTILTYKHLQNRRNAKVFNLHINKAIVGKQDSSALSLLEESSGRELYDVLAKDGFVGDTEMSEFAQSAIGESYGGPFACDGGSGGRRSGLRRMTDQQQRDTREAFLKQAMRAFEADARKNPIPVAPYDTEFVDKLVEHSERHPSFALARFFTQVKEGEEQLGVFVLRNGVLQYNDLGLWNPDAFCEEMINDDGDLVPTPEFAHRIGQRFFPDEIWNKITEDDPQHVVVVPHGKMFNLPLHLATTELGKKPLCACAPLCFSVSSVMHLATGRNNLRTIPVRNDDMLVLISKLDAKRVTGAEVCGVRWIPDQIRVFGEKPQELNQNVKNARADWDTLASFDFVPRFVCVASHGDYDPKLDDVYGPTLDLGEGAMRYVSQFDIARRMHFQGNRFLSINACVSGQGAGRDGADVSGFLRSFIAAGAGALGVTQFHVLDRCIVQTVKNLLLESRRAAESDNNFDVVHQLTKYYSTKNPKHGMDQYPLVLYL